MRIRIMKKSILFLTMTTLMLTSCILTNSSEKTNESMENPKKIVEPDKSQSLRIVRQFNVAPEFVFDVFTKPEAMRVWWTEETTFDIDLRVGGQWAIIRKEAETVYTATGEYLEIENPHRLKYTYGMPQFSQNSDTISIDIAADGKSGCVVTFVVTGQDITSELRELQDGDISHSEKGWQQGFDLMAEAWEGKRHSGN